MLSLCKHTAATTPSVNVTSMRNTSLHGDADNVSKAEAASRHQAAGLASNAQIIPDAGAIWEAKFIICFPFLRAAASSTSGCTVISSIKAPDTREERGGDYVSNERTHKSAPLSHVQHVKGRNGAG